MQYSQMVVTCAAYKTMAHVSRHGSPTLRRTGARRL